MAKRMPPTGEADVEEVETFELLGRILDRTDLPDLPKPEPLIDGWLDLRTAVVLLGDTGTNKTFALLGWACSIATGTPWLGHRVCIPPSAVILVVGEGAHGLDGRIEAWEEEHDTDVQQGKLTVLKQPGGCLINQEFWEQLRALAEIRGARFVVLDTFSSLAPEADETKDAAKVVRRMSELATAIDGSVILAHHTGWNEKARARGGSQLESNPDGVLVLQSKEKNQNGSVELWRKKVKDGPSGAKLYLRRKQVAESCVLEVAADGVDGWAPRNNNNVERLVLDWIKTNEAGTKTTCQKSLLAEGAVTEPQVRKAFDSLASQGLIVSEKRSIEEGGRSVKRDVLVCGNAKRKARKTGSKQQTILGGNLGGTHRGSTRRQPRRQPRRSGADSPSDQGK